MERIMVAICDTCGVIVVHHDPESGREVAKSALADEEEPVVSRCAIVYALDGGEEDCQGNLVLRGYLDLLAL